MTLIADNHIYEGREDIFDSLTLARTKDPSSRLDVSEPRAAAGRGPGSHVRPVSSRHSATGSKISA